MDVRPDSTSPDLTSTTCPDGDRDDLRTLLPDLGRELCRPISDLRGELDRIPAGPATSAAGPVQAMMTLCDELLALTYRELIEGNPPPAGES